jgi:hypothetical protein
MCADGTIPARKHGWSWIIDEDDLWTFFYQRRDEALKKLGLIEIELD